MFKHSADSIIIHKVGGLAPVAFRQPGNESFCPAYVWLDPASRIVSAGYEEDDASIPEDILCRRRFRFRIDPLLSAESLNLLMKTIAAYAVIVCDGRRPNGRYSMKAEAALGHIEDACVDIDYDGYTDEYCYAEEYLIRALRDGASLHEEGESAEAAAHRFCLSAEKACCRLEDGYSGMLAAVQQALRDTVLQGRTD